MTQPDETVAMLSGLIVDNCEDDNPGGTGGEENFRNFMLREIAIQLARIAVALEKVGKP